MNQILRVAQIGAGQWGQNLLRNLASCPTVELAAICDSSKKGLKDAAKRYPEARQYSDIADVLSDKTIDAVVIATPSGMHFEHTHGALAAGKHAFVEKPLAHTTEEAVTLAEKAEQAGLTLMVGHTFLFNNVVHEVKKYIDSGELGEIYCAYSQRLNLGRFRSDSDVMWTLAPHDVSILNYWFDGLPEKVSARGHTYIHKKSEVAEVCYAQLDYPGGRNAHLHLSWLDPQKRREMVVVGSKKMLVYDDMSSDAHIRLYDKSAEAHHQSAIADFTDFTTRLRAGDLVVPKTRLVEPLSVEIAHFAKCCLENEVPRTGGRHAVEVIAVLEALERSMSNDGATYDVERRAA